MQLSADALNRTTLGRQLLLARADLEAADAVRHIVAVQAQQAASPYLALWSRVRDFAAADLDEAFADREVVKATLVRATLHAVHRDDYPAFHVAVRDRLRANRLTDGRFAAVGLTSDDVDELVPLVLEYAERARSNAELSAMIESRTGPLPAPGVWWAIRMFAPVHHAPTGATWAFGERPAYRTAERLPDLDPDEAAQTTVRRYLDGFGPASAADVAQFLKMPLVATRAALRAMSDLVTIDGPHGARLHDVPGGVRWPARTAAPPRLLPMWDSTLLAYADRGRMITPEYRAHVIRRNGDVLPTLLVDGRVAGVWRPVDDGIEVTAFASLTAQVWRRVHDEARALRAFLADREPLVYRRYRHWWATLPAAEVRVLS